MTTDLQSYTNELLIELRTRDLPEPQIAPALAGVRSHVRKTGEDPREAFGPPTEYAENLTSVLGEPEQPGLRGVILLAAVYGLSGFVGAWLTLDGVLGVPADEPGLLGLPATTSLALGATVLAAMAFALTRLAHRSDNPALDPRTGVDMTAALPRWVLPALLIPPGLAMALGRRRSARAALRCPGRTSNT